MLVRCIKVGSEGLLSSGMRSSGMEVYYLWCDLGGDIYWPLEPLKHFSYSTHVKSYLTSDIKS